MPVNWFLFSAAAAALISFGVHTFIGGKYAARPLLAAKELPKASIWLNYFCWHIVTALLLILAATFALAAVHALSRDAAIVCAVIAASISVLSIAVTLRAGIAVHRFPASYLLGVTAALAFLGCCQ